MKKIALPVLAIGAVVLTGGAALGIGLPSLATVGAKLGLSTALQGVLSTAGTSALLGAGGALLTGGNVVKGATAGFLTGGVVGGLGAALAKPAGMVAAGAPGGGIGGGVTQAGAGGVIPAASQGTQLGGFAQAAGQTLGEANLARLGAAGAQGIASSAPLPSSGGFLGGLGRFVEKNPLIAGTALQGIGGGLMAAQDANARRKAEERIAANYTTDGLFQLEDDDFSAVQAQGQRYSDIINGRVRVDRRTGRLYADGVGG